MSKSSQRRKRGKIPTILSDVIRKRESSEVDRRGLQQLQNTTASLQSKQGDY